MVDDIASIKMARSAIEYLPDEIILNIFSYLKEEDVALTARNVCMNWRRIADSESLWTDYELSAGYLPIEKTVALIQNIPCLRKFSLCNENISTDVYEILFSELATNCEQLTYLYIPYARVRSEVLYTLLQNLSSLEKLAVPLPYDDVILTEVIGSSETIKYLSLVKRDEQEFVNPHVLKPIALGCPSLTSLNLQRFCTNIATEDVNYLIRSKATALRVLSWTGTMHFSTLTRIGNCKILKSLHLEEFDLIGHNPQAHYVTLPFIENLECVTYHCSDIVYLPIILANNYTNLKHLTISDATGNTNLSLQDIFCNCNYLQTLSLIAMELNDDAIYELSSQFLRELYIETCSGWSHNSIHHLRTTCKNMNNIGLGSSDLSREMCLEIIQFENLEFIYFADCALEHFDFRKVVTDLPRLKSLTICECNLEASHIEALQILSSHRPNVKLEY